MKKGRKKWNPESTYKRHYPKITHGNANEYSEEYPELPRRGERRHSTAQRAPQTNRQQQGENNNTDEFHELNNAFEELNSLVNMSELLRAVRDLNSKLRTSRTQKDIFETYRTFYDNLNTYNFRN